ncbi:hypothetical protein LJC42_07935 [Eubacteriales bacterium OttesenSCG-928-K08]|nr:hypothetical protein [Eubacteriales bacterium OttesenSCG-928-K08]
MPPIVEEIGTITLARNSEPVIIDLAVSDRETEACELIAFASTDASQNNIASVDVLFDKDNNLWQLHIAPIKNAYGSCPVTLTVADAQGGQTAVDWELNITKDSLPVQAINDAILFEGAGNIIIDALQNDIAYDDVDIKLKRTGKAQFGSVTIDNGMIVYVPDDYSQGILPDYFTYTISRSGKKHKQDVLTATVCINDSTAPKIADIAIKRGEGSLWSPSFTLSTRVEDDTVVSSVILKAASSGQIWQPEAVQDKNTYVFTVETGGEFIIEATDIGGNVSTKSITVENIDSIPPTIDLSASTSLREGYLGNNGVFSVLVRDDQSGVASLMVLDDDGKAVAEAIVSSGDGGRYNIDLSSLPEGSELLLAAYDNAGQKTQLELNELRFDQEPPMIEIAFANEDNCYYAPRTFTVADEKSGVLSVTINGEPLELADAYTLPVSWNEQNTVLIEAVDHVGNTAQLQVQMLGIPSVIDLDAVSDTAALRKISADMRERLNSMNTDDPVYLPGDTPISLLDFLGVLEVEIEMIELLNQPRPLTQAHQPHFEEVSQNLSALNGIQDDYLSPALTQAFTGLWDELQIGNLAHRIDALPEAAPTEFDEALASAVEELVISVSKAPATHLSTEHAQKLENLYDALLAQNNIQNRDEATGVRALGMLSALNVPKNENITRIYLDVQPISQADGITYPIYNHQENDDIVYSSGYTMYVKGETANGTIDIPIKPGSAIVLELPLQEDCDPDAMLAFRKTDGMTKQLLDIAPLERENAQFMSLFTHALEEITIYTRVQAPQEDDPAPLPEDESPAPEQTPETSTPAPEITPEPEQPAQAEQTAKPEPTPAPDATPGGFLAEDEATDAFAAYDETATPISEIPLWPIAAVATITLLIIIIRICFALFNGKSDKV